MSLRSRQTATSTPIKGDQRGPIQNRSTDSNSDSTSLHTATAHNTFNIALTGINNHRLTSNTSNGSRMIQDESEQFDNNGDSINTINHFSSKPPQNPPQQHILPLSFPSQSSQSQSSRSQSSLSSNQLVHSSLRSSPSHKTISSLHDDQMTYLLQQHADNRQSLSPRSLQPRSSRLSQQNQQNEQNQQNHETTPASLSTANTSSQSTQRIHNQIYNQPHASLSPRTMLNTSAILSEHQKADFSTATHQIHHNSITHQTTITPSTTIHPHHNPTNLSITTHPSQSPSHHDHHTSTSPPLRPLTNSLMRLPPLTSSPRHHSINTSSPPLNPLNITTIQYSSPDNTQKKHQTMTFSHLNLSPLPLSPLSHSNPIRLINIPDHQDFMGQDDQNILDLDQRSGPMNNKITHKVPKMDPNNKNTQKTSPRGDKSHQNLISLDLSPNSALLSMDTNQYATLPYQTLDQLLVQAHDAENKLRLAKDKVQQYRLVLTKQDEKIQRQEEWILKSDALVGQLTETNKMLSQQLLDHTETNKILSQQSLEQSDVINSGILGRRRNGVDREGKGSFNAFQNNEKYLKNLNEKLKRSNTSTKSADQHANGYDNHSDDEYQQGGNDYDYKKIDKNGQNGAKISKGGKGGNQRDKKLLFHSFKQFHQQIEQQHSTLLQFIQLLTDSTIKNANSGQSSVVLHDDGVVDGFIQRFDENDALFSQIFNKMDQHVAFCNEVSTKMDQSLNILDQIVTSVDINDHTGSGSLQKDILNAIHDQKTIQNEIVGIVSTTQTMQNDILAFVNNGKLVQEEVLIGINKNQVAQDAVLGKIVGISTTQDEILDKISTIPNAFNEIDDINKVIREDIVNGIKGISNSIQENIASKVDLNQSVQEEVLNRVGISQSIQDDLYQNQVEANKMLLSINEMFIRQIDNINVLNDKIDQSVGHFSSKNRENGENSENYENNPKDEDKAELFAILRKELKEQQEMNDTIDNLKHQLDQQKNENLQQKDEIIQLYNQMMKERIENQRLIDQKDNHLRLNEERMKKNEEKMEQNEVKMQKKEERVSFLEAEVESLKRQLQQASSSSKYHPNEEGLGNTHQYQHSRGNNPDDQDENYHQNQHQNRNKDQYSQVDDDDILLLGHPLLLIPHAPLIRTSPPSAPVSSSPYLSPARPLNAVQSSSLPTYPNQTNQQHIIPNQPNPPPTYNKKAYNTLYPLEITNFLQSQQEFLLERFKHEIVTQIMTLFTPVIHEIAEGQNISICLQKDVKNIANIVDKLFKAIELGSDPLDDFKANGQGNRCKLEESQQSGGNGPKLQNGPNIISVNDRHKFNPSHRDKNNQLSDNVVNSVQQCLVGQSDEIKIHIGSAFQGQSDDIKINLDCAFQGQNYEIKTHIDSVFEDLLPLIGALVDAVKDLRHNQSTPIQNNSPLQDTNVFSGMTERGGEEDGLMLLKMSGQLDTIQETLLNHIPNVLETTINHTISQYNAMEQRYQSLNDVMSDCKDNIGRLVQTDDGNTDYNTKSTNIGISNTIMSLQSIHQKLDTLGRLTFGIELSQGDDQQDCDNTISATSNQNDATSQNQHNLTNSIQSAQIPSFYGTYVDNSDVLYDMMAAISQRQEFIIEKIQDVEKGHKRGENNVIKMTENNDLSNYQSPNPSSTPELELIDALGNQKAFTEALNDQKELKETLNDVKMKISTQFPLILQRLLGNDLFSKQLHEMILLQQDNLKELAVFSQRIGELGTFQNQHFEYLKSFEGKIDQFLANVNQQSKDVQILDYVDEKGTKNSNQDDDLDKNATPFSSLNLDHFNAIISLLKNINKSITSITLNHLKNPNASNNNLNIPTIFPHSTSLNTTSNLALTSQQHNINNTYNSLNQNTHNLNNSLHLLQKNTNNLNNTINSLHNNTTNLTDTIAEFTNTTHNLNNSLDKLNNAGLNTTNQSLQFVSFHNNTDDNDNHMTPKSTAKKSARGTITVDDNYITTELMGLNTPTRSRGENGGNWLGNTPKSTNLKISRSLDDHDIDNIVHFNIDELDDVSSDLGRHSGYGDDSVAQKNNSSFKKDNHILQKVDESYQNQVVTTHFLSSNSFFGGSNEMVKQIHAIIMDLAGITLTTSQTIQFNAMNTVHVLNQIEGIKSGINYLIEHNLQEAFQNFLIQKMEEKFNSDLFAEKMQIFEEKFKQLEEMEEKKVTQEFLLEKIEACFKENFSFEKNNHFLSKVSDDVMTHQTRLLGQVSQNLINHQNDLFNKVSGEMAGQQTIIVNAISKVPSDVMNVQTTMLSKISDDIVNEQKGLIQNLSDNIIEHQTSLAEQTNALVAQQTEIITRVSEDLVTQQADRFAQQHDLIVKQESTHANFIKQQTNLHRDLITEQQKFSNTLTQDLLTQQQNLSNSLTQELLTRQQQQIDMGFLTYYGDQIDRLDQNMSMLMRNVAMNISFDIPNNENGPNAGKDGQNQQDQQNQQNRYNHDSNPFSFINRHNDIDYHGNTHHHNDLGDIDPEKINGREFYTLGNQDDGDKREEDGQHRINVTNNTTQTSSKSSLNHRQTLLNQDDAQTPSKQHLPAHLSPLKVERIIMSLGKRGAFDKVSRQIPAQHENGEGMAYQHDKYGQGNDQRRENQESDLPGCNYNADFMGVINNNNGSNDPCNNNINKTTDLLNSTLDINPTTNNNHTTLFPHSHLDLNHINDTNETFNDQMENNNDLGNNRLDNNNDPHFADHLIPHFDQLHEVTPKTTSTTRKSLHTLLLQPLVPLAPISSRFTPPSQFRTKALSDSNSRLDDQSDLAMKDDNDNNSTLPNNNNTLPNNNNNNLNIDHDNPHITNSNPPHDSTLNDTANSISLPSLPQPTLQFQTPAKPTKNRTSQVKSDQIQDKPHHSNGFEDNLDLDDHSRDKNYSFGTNNNNDHFGDGLNNNHELDTNSLIQLNISPIKPIPINPHSGNKDEKGRFGRFDEQQQLRGQGEDSKRDKNDKKLHNVESVDNEKYDEDRDQEEDSNHDDLMTLFSSPHRSQTHKSNNDGQEQRPIVMMSPSHHHRAEKRQDNNPLSPQQQQNNQMNNNELQPSLNSRNTQGEKTQKQQHSGQISTLKPLQPIKPLPPLRQLQPLKPLQPLPLLVENIKSANKNVNDVSPRQPPQVKSFIDFNLFDEDE